MYAVLPSVTPLEVIFLTSTSLPTDPRDGLFGILSLMPAASSCLPGYTKSLAQAPCSFTRWYANTLESWDVLSLCHPRGQRSWYRNKTIPSWVIDFSKDCRALHPFALRKLAHSSPMFSAGIASGFGVRLLPRVTGTKYGKLKIPLVGCIAARVVNVWAPMEVEFRHCQIQVSGRTKRIPLLSNNPSCHRTSLQGLLVSSLSSTQPDHGKEG